MHRTTVAFLPEAMLLNIPELDAQHEALFARLAAVKAHCLETGRLPAAQSGQLLADLLEHFATEERLAAAASMPFADHAASHRELHAFLVKAVDEVREGRREIFSLLRYLDYWFELHISDEDRQFTAYLPVRRSIEREQLQAA